jgi:hypothetical protein
VVEGSTRVVVIVLPPVVRAHSDEDDAGPAAVTPRRGGEGG